MITRICPHWWTETMHPDESAIMYDEVSREKCMICGKRRVYAKVPEPHPSRDKEQLLKQLQRPTHEVVVDEWLPYQSAGPTADNREKDAES